MRTQIYLHIEESRKDTPNIPTGLALLSTLIGSNNPCLELIFMVPKVFEPLKFYCILCILFTLQRSLSELMTKLSQAQPLFVR